MALTFTTTANVNFGSGATLALAGAAQTWSWFGWIFPTSDVAGRPFSIGAASTDHKRLIVRPTYSLRMATLRAAGVTPDTYDSAVNVLTRNIWHFIVLVYDSSLGAGLRFAAYRGTLGAPPIPLILTPNVDGSGNCDDDSADSYIAGNSSAGTDPFNGRIYNFGYFPGRVLSPAQVAQLWKFPRSAILMGAKLYSELGYHAIGTQPDLTGNANHGTLTGAKLAADPLFTQPLSAQLRHIINAPPVIPRLKPWQLQAQMGGLIAQ
jgi:hypothetical protein